MSPKPTRAPTNLEAGKSKSAATINSTEPVPILPQGSIPKVEKICTDSSCPVNLKNKVCKNTRAEKTESIVDNRSLTV